MVINWEAIGAISTTVAVLIALLPVFDTWRNNHSVEVNTRAQMLLYFIALRPIVARRFTDTKVGPETAEPLSGKELEPLKAIEELIPKAIVLSSVEHDLIMAAFTNLTLMKMVQEITPRTGKDVLGQIDLVVCELKKKKCFQGESVTVPWSEPIEEKNSPGNGIRS